MNAILINTHRTGYSIDQIGSTMTAGELIRFLEDYDEDTPIYFKNDGGYTYGGFNMGDIEDSEDEEYEE